MEGIPINIIGKGGTTCAPGQVCPYLVEKVTEHTVPAVTFLPQIMIFGFIIGSVALVAIFGIKWIYERQRSPFS